MRTIALTACLLLACSREHDPPAPPPTPPPAKTAVAIRGAAGDRDLRMLLAEVASAKACEMIRGQFRGLRAPDRPDVVTGVLWIRDCRITHDGTRVTYAISGNGWQWAQQTKHQAGGTFVVHQYVKFGVRASIVGALDVAYDTHDHVLSFWFTPEHPPEIAFEPIGTVEVDRRGLWSSIIGGFSSVFGDSPNTQGKHQAKQQGTEQFLAQLSDGLTVAIDACSGYQRFSLGRPPKGSLGPPDVGETPRIPVELDPGALFVFGPEQAEHGMTIDVDAPDGPALVQLACAEHAEHMADGFVNGPAPGTAAVLAQRVIRGHGRLHVGPTACKVAVVARSVIAQKVTIDWRRPAGEQARSTGGPMIQCR